MRGLDDVASTLRAIDGSRDVPGAVERSDGPDPFQMEHVRPSLASKVITAGQLRDLPPPEPLIAGVLDLDSVAVLYGPSGGYKTFLAFDWALSVATGTWWQRQHTEHASVLYVAGEGVSGLWPRIDAWLQHQHLHTPPAQFYVLPEAVNLLAFERAGELTELARTLDVRMVVIDTLARSMIGGEENGTKDMGVAVEQADRIRRATGACVLLVHHAGKDVERGPRGSSALFAAADTVIACSAADDVVTVEMTKSKNHRASRPWTFRATQVADSIVLSDATYNPTDSLPESVAKTLESLAAVTVPGGVSATTWRLSSGQKEATFFRHRKDLLTLGLVENVGSDNQPRYQPKDPSTLTTITELSRSHESPGQSTITLSPPFKGESSDSDPDLRAF